MDWQRISHWAEAQRPLDELRAAFRRTDLIALDLDECIFPGFTQKELGVRVARRLLRRPQRAADRRFLPQLGLGAVLFAVKETKRFFGLDTPVRRLMRRYERVMRGVPESYLVEAALSIPGDSCAYAAETVAELATQAPTGIITLGIDIVARAYVERFRTAAGPSLSFFDANAIVFGPGPSGSRAFAGYDHTALMLAGEDKRLALERRLKEFGAAVPSTIGHSEPDVAIARVARERGGLAIGLNPSAGLEEAFDIVVRGRDWEPLYALVAILAGPPAAGKE